MLTQNKRLFGIVALVVIILLVPLIAMQFSTDVDWSMADFAIAGGLLLGTGLLCEFVIRKVTKKGLRIAICVGILVVLLLVWAELAVGLFGRPFAGS